ncbi:MAG: hypothetical protein A2Y79_09580 [Deltaproteobacteria bacterium RBG_13_43_22]|nr:MAG: hypothetical protein A2Y79_09580 [Deltaproteobacteria bacterium RBG_13_43_22]
MFFPSVSDFFKKEGFHNHNLPKKGSWAHYGYLFIGTNEKNFRGGGVRSIFLTFKNKNSKPLKIERVFKSVYRTIYYQEICQ